MGIVMPPTKAGKRARRSVRDLLGDSHRPRSGQRCTKLAGSGLTGSILLALITDIPSPTVGQSEKRHSQNNRQHDVSWGCDEVADRLAPRPPKRAFPLWRQIHKRSINCPKRHLNICTVSASLWGVVGPLLLAVGQRGSGSTGDRG